MRFSSDPRRACSAVAAVLMLAGGAGAVRTPAVSATPQSRVPVRRAPRDLLWAAPGNANTFYGPSQLRSPGEAAAAAPSATIVLQPDAALQANAAARAAFAAAADVWAHTIASSATIRVAVSFRDLGDPNLLGAAGPTVLCGLGSTYYPAALYDQLRGVQECADAGGETAEIYAEFNSTFDWDFGTSGTPVIGKVNFMTVVLHELGHGLGFLGSMDADSVSGTFRGTYWNPPIVYDRFATTGAGGRLLDLPNASAALAAQLVSNNIYFDGPFARAGNSGIAPKLESHHFTTFFNVPAPPVDNGFLSGSSYSHLDDVVYSPDGSGARPNGLMTWQLQRAEVYTDPGPIVRGIFRDMGWTLADAAPPVCSYSLAPGSYAAAAAGGSSTVEVSTAAGCPWTAVSEAAFISITAGGAGSGSGTVTFGIAANPTAAARIGQIAIAGQTFTVIQSAACSFVVSPLSLSAPAAASTLTVSVTTAPGCSWSAASLADFLTVTSGSPATGSGIVTVGVVANPYTATRTGTLLVAGRTLSVAQHGVPAAVPGDFDGDRRADATLFRPSTGDWRIRWSGHAFADGVELPFGLSTDRPVPGDYDGDGRMDMAVYRPSNGTWYVIYSSTRALVALQWGIASDVPMPADFTGDGRTDLAVWRPSTGVWYIFNLATGSYTTRQWGVSTDLPLTGDFDADGLADVAVYRPSTGVWWVFFSSSQTYAPLQWGVGADRPLPADYTGDGRTDLGIYRPADGRWYIFDLATGTYGVYQWGISTDQPAPNDYDGDGRADLAVYRPATGEWLIYLLGPGTFRAFVGGGASDQPVR